MVDRVKRISSTPIDGEHHVARVVLADGRALTVSPEHPVRGGTRVQDLRAGDVYDGSAIVTLELVRYSGARTYDILGESGEIYWANDIPIQSTLGRASSLVRQAPTPTAE
jgi:hypothetical protein